MRTPARPHQRCTCHHTIISPARVPEHHTPSPLCCGLLGVPCRCLASAGIVIPLDFLWAFITIGGVVALGEAYPRTKSEEIETVKTAMLIAAIVAAIRLCVDIFGFQAVKKFNAANIGHYWKITLLFALLGLIGPLVIDSADSRGLVLRSYWPGEMGVFAVEGSIVVLLLNLWWVFAIRALATQLELCPFQSPQMPQNPVSAAAAAAMQTPAPMAYTPAVAPPQQLVPMAITAPAAPPTSSLDLELQQLKLPELRKRAAAAGVSHDAIEEARDSDEPKPAIIALIKAAAARNAAKQRAQVAEMQQLTLPELRKRAAAAGVDPDALEEARDSDEPKQAIIGLILAKRAEP